jgi:hypothetical protein
MNQDEYVADSTLIEDLRDSLAELPVPGRPPLAEITSRGRVRRRRRRFAGFAGLAVTGAAAGVALALGLTGVFGLAPARGTKTVHTAAFTLTSYTNGTVSLRLGQLFDPIALQRALAHAGVPALVTNGRYCTSSPAVTSPAINAVLPGSATPPNGVHGILVTANFPVKPSQLAPSVDPEAIEIDPAGLRPGTELFIGYFDLGHTVLADLVYTGSHICSGRQSPPGDP